MDIGATKISAVVAAAGRPIGLGAVPMPGWPARFASEGEIAGGIRQAFLEANAMAGHKPKDQIWVAFPAVSTIADVSSGSIRVQGPDGRVDSRDLRQAMGAAFPEKAFFIHRWLASAALDGQRTLENPVGRPADRLEASVLTVLPELKRLAEMEKPIAAAGLSIEGYVLSPVAAASVLSPAEKEIGVLLLEMGARQSSAMIYARGAPRFYAAIPYGGFLVTRDLSVALGQSLARAEQVKLQLEADASPDQAELPFAAVSARITEIMELLRKALAGTGWDGALPGGIVLTGGGAAPGYAIALARRVFGAEARLGLPQMDQVTAGPGYAVILGLAAAAGEYGLARASVGAKGVGWWKSRSLEHNLPVSK